MKEKTYSQDFWIIYNKIRDIRLSDEEFKMIEEELFAIRLLNNHPKNMLIEKDIKDIEPIKKFQPFNIFKRKEKKDIDYSQIKKIVEDDTISSIERIARLKAMYRG